MSGLFAILGFILAAALILLLWPQRHSKVALPVALYLVVTCAGIYAMVGSPRILPLLAERQERMARVQQSILTHSETVKADPKNLRAWVELGQAFIETGQFDAAANALRRAVVLSGGEPSLILAYAKSTILHENGKVSDHARKSLEMVLLQDAKNPEARYWINVRRLQDGDSAQAMQDMKALYHELPQDSPLKAMIDRQIGRD